MTFTDLGMAADTMMAVFWLLVLAAIVGTIIQEVYRGRDWKDD